MYHFIDIKFTVLSTPKCTVQWHKVHSPLVVQSSLPSTSRTFSSSQRSSIHVQPHLPIRVSPQNLETAMLLSVSLNLTVPGTPCKWRHTVFIVLWLAYFIEHNVFKVICVVGCWSFLTFSGWIITFHCDRPRFVYPFICSQMFGLLPPSGYCE